MAAEGQHKSLSLIDDDQQSVRHQAKHCQHATQDSQNLNVTQNVGREHCLLITDDGKNRLGTSVLQSVNRLKLSVNRLKILGGGGGGGVSYEK